MGMVLAEEPQLDRSGLPILLVKQMCLWEQMEDRDAGLHPLKKQ